MLFGGVPDARSSEMHGTASRKVIGMGTIEDIGELCGWRCWICDEPVKMDAAANDDQGSSLDRCEVFMKPSKKKQEVEERLAHRRCNTKKGAIKPVINWPEHFILFDPAPIIQSAERLITKGGREMVARCASKSDANEAGTWLQDRLHRLVPSVDFSIRIDEGGGQYLLSLLAPRP